MIRRLVKVARRQVRRSARPFQTVIPNASLLYVNPPHGCENTCGVHRETLEGFAIKYYVIMRRRVASPRAGAALSQSLVVSECVVA